MAGRGGAEAGQRTGGSADAGGGAMIHYILDTSNFVVTSRLLKLIQKNTLWLLSFITQIFANKIKTYLINTHEETHSGYTVDIVQIFKMSSHGETKRFQKFASTGNRMLLWHGSRLTNWAGILSQGLRFHMFGKGVYFADMFSKSANCCYGSKASRSGVLLLCEVALGDMNEVLNGDYKANDLPKGKLRTTDDGVLVPLGKPTKHESSEMARSRYNDYIVYNTDQIKMRYALHVTFNFKS
ncbi:hypothetical protein HU200_016739 [Digitaria exilis]|uniref:Poly [ADP-ribose] polymerase n=1 Tax=Digitaria exilis TaxID=1010633 RepID=A0A835KI45_9POAL|nr:hypothetical protein HU200_016739 [Digitaria exilis]